MAATIPILPSRDLTATSDFYAALGWTEVGRFDHDYLILRSDDGLELHFWLHETLDPWRDAYGCFVRLESAAAVSELHAEWGSRLPTDGRITDPEETDYALLEFALHDPDNNQLRVGGAL